MSNMLRGKGALKPLAVLAVGLSSLALNACGWKKHDYGFNIQCPPSSRPEVLGYQDQLVSNGDQTSISVACIRAGKLLLPLEITQVDAQDAADPNVPNMDATLAVGLRQDTWPGDDNQTNFFIRRDPRDGNVAQIIVDPTDKVNFESLYVVDHLALIEPLGLQN